MLDSPLACIELFHELCPTQLLPTEHASIAFQINCQNHIRRGSNRRTRRLRRLQISGSRNRCHLQHSIPTAHCARYWRHRRHSRGCHQRPAECRSDFQLCPRRAVRIFCDKPRSQQHSHDLSSSACDSTRGHRDHNRNVSDRYHQIRFSNDHHQLASNFWLTPLGKMEVSAQRTAVVCSSTIEWSKQDREALVGESSRNHFSIKILPLTSYFPRLWQALPS